MEAMTRRRRIRGLVLAVTATLVVVSCTTGTAEESLAPLESATSTPERPSADADLTTSSLAVATTEARGFDGGQGAGGDPSSPTLPGSGSSGSGTGVGTTLPPITTTTTVALPGGVEIPVELLGQVVVCRAGEYLDDTTADGDLAPCMAGPSVEQLQQALNRWGLGNGLSIDGYFGPATQRALLAWQVRHGWPTPTTQLSKWDALLAMVLVALDSTDLAQDVTCPVWFTPTADNVTFAESDPRRPVMQLCDEGPLVQGVQNGLAEWGYPVEVTGRFDEAMYEAIRRFNLEQRQLDSGVLDFDGYWMVVGD